MMMKSLMSILILIGSTNVMAVPTDKKSEALQIANVILDNPAATAQVKNEDLNITDYSTAVLSLGVNQFTFKLGRTCFCPTKTGTLTITQDLRPTFADGAIKYDFDLKID